jgi:hypothetical protein
MLVGERGCTRPVSAMEREDDDAEGEQLAGLPRKAGLVTERMARFHQSSSTSRLIRRKECLRIAGGLYRCSGCI